MNGILSRRGYLSAASRLIDEIAHDTKHSDREANSPCVAEGRWRRASVRRQDGSREEGEESDEEADEMTVEAGGVWRKHLTVAIVALAVSFRQG